MSGRHSNIPKGSISATALSELALCQQMVALKQRGNRTAPSREHAQWMDRGTQMHVASERAAKVVATRAPAPASSPGGGAAPSKGACFLASEVYGPAHPKTCALRTFRDRTLRRTRAGRAFIALYYRTSPPVAAFLHRHRWAKTFVRFGLDALVRLVTIASPSRHDTRVNR